MTVVTIFFANVTSVFFGDVTAMVQERFFGDVTANLIPYLPCCSRSPPPPTCRARRRPLSQTLDTMATFRDPGGKRGRRPTKVTERPLLEVEREKKQLEKNQLSFCFDFFFSPTAPAPTWQLSFCASPNLEIPLENVFNKNL